MKKLLLAFILSIILLSEPILAQDLWRYYFNPNFLGGLFTRGGIIAFVGIMVVLSQLDINLTILSLGTYAFFCLVLSGIAKRSGISNSWLAWIPGVNLFLMATLAEVKFRVVWILLASHLLGALILFVYPSLATKIISMLPLVGLMVVFVIFWIRIAKRMGKSWIIGLLVSIPLVKLIPLGIFMLHKTKVQLEEKVPETRRSKPSASDVSSGTEEQKIRKMTAYIKQNLKQGHDISSVRKSLLQQGFNPRLVNKAIRMVS